MSQDVKKNGYLLTSYHLRRLTPYFFVVSLPVISQQREIFSVLVNDLVGEPGDVLLSFVHAGSP
jgi:hypothetical protein